MNTNNEVRIDTTWVRAWTKWTVFILLWVFWIGIGEMAASILGYPGIVGGVIFGAGYWLYRDQRPYVRLEDAELVIGYKGSKKRTNPEE